jgi:hypothetical protein
VGDGTFAINVGNTAGAQVTALSAATDGTLTLLKPLVVPSVNGVTGLTVTSSQTTPLPASGTTMSYTHGLGVVPADAQLELVCLTAELGYAVGDVVQNPLNNGGGTYYSPVTVRKNTTVVAATNANAWGVNHATTGGVSNPTSANWAWRFKVRTA